MKPLPFPTNWGEELISEYLELEGYFVRTNLPVPTEEKGGRGELDILGVKVEDEQLKILHIETGIPSRLGEMKRIFASSTTKEIRRIARDFGFEENYVLERWYVHTWGGQKGLSRKWGHIKEELEQEGVALMTFEEVLKKIAEAINKWREKYRGKAQQSSLPSSLWLLKMLESLLVSKRLRVP